MIVSFYSILSNKNRLIYRCIMFIMIIMGNYQQVKILEQLSGHFNGYPVILLDIWPSNRISGQLITYDYIVNYNRI